MKPWRLTEPLDQGQGSISNAQVIKPCSDEPLGSMNFGCLNATAGELEEDRWWWEGLSRVDILLGLFPVNWQVPAPEQLRMTKFTHVHRDFLNRLRAGNWVPARALPEQPQTKLTMLSKGWIERRDLPEVAYRITEAGLQELTRPR